MDAIVRRQLVLYLFKDRIFAHLSSNESRVQHALRHLKSFSDFRSLVQASVEATKLKSAKSVSIAVSHAAEAAMFSRHAQEKPDPSLWQSALVSLDKAILYTPTSETKFLSQLYVDRSKAYSALSDYGAAMYSIERAMQICGEEDTFEHLRLRAKYLSALNADSMEAQMIAEILNDEVEASKWKDELQSLIDQLAAEAKAEEEEAISEEESHLPHQLDGRCQIVDSPVVGRHMIALDDIPQGVHLLTEKAYSVVLKPSSILARCSHCFRQLGHKLYPCQYCVDVVFCDRDCFLNAYESFHRFECGFLLLIMNMVKPALHIFRILSRLGPLEAFEAQQTTKQFSVKDYMTDEDTKSTQEKKIAAFKMAAILCDHDSEHTAMQNAHHTILAIEMAALLDLMHGISYRLLANQLPAFIGAIISHIRRVSFNIFGWQELGDAEQDLKTMGHCLCLAGSLVNHSCAPNLDWKFVDGKLCFTTNQPISKGAQLTITYGPSVALDYSERQEMLNEYLFACSCQLCFADALQKEDFLRCRSCSGPVLVDSPANKVPTLKGRCLLCYAKYKQFGDSIAALEAAKRVIASLEQLSKLQLPQDLEEQCLSQTIAVTKNLADLTLANNTQKLDSSIVACSLIIQRLAGQFYWSCSPVEQAQLAVLFDAHLPLEMTAEMVNGAIISNLHFWLRLLMEHLTRPLKAVEQVALWNCMLNFSYRLSRSVDSLDAEAEHSAPLKKLIADQLETGSQAVHQLMDQYGGPIQFIQLQDRVQAQLPWA